MTQINNFQPTYGAIGANVTFTGTDLHGVTGVTFTQGVQAPIEEMGEMPNDTWMEVNVPQGAQTGPITVAITGGPPWISPTPFTVQGGNDELDTQINSFDPPEGSAGTEVTFEGQDLQAVTAVTFFEEVAAVILEMGEPPNDTFMTVAVPEGAQTGPITVETRYGVQLNPGQFTVTA